MLNDLNAAMVGHLLLAALLGGLVGLERQLRHKPAGLRTNMLICFGSALFTMISYDMAGNVGGDHTRIAAQIIPGIGFIGAGVVLRERGTIVGITSAATIFVMASIGMAVGAGMEWTAIFATMFCLVALILLGQAGRSHGLGQPDHDVSVCWRRVAGNLWSVRTRSCRMAESARIAGRRAPWETKRRWNSTRT